MKLADVKDKSLNEEGERMVPAFHKGALVYGEHLVRYESVLPLVKGKTVLDIASGSGYGTSILATEAKKVIGVEIDEDSVKYAKKFYGKDNTDFVQGSAESIPLDDGSVDVVVTFETIEHIKNYRKFLAEMKRVLKPGGIAIVSTPNDPEFPEGNHFHLHEFEHEELKAELKNLFKNVRFSYQYTWLYTAMLSDGAASKEWKRDLETDNYAPVDKNKSLYFMVVCSDESLAKVPEVKELAAISEHWSARRVQEAEEQRQKELEEVREHLKNTTKDVENLRELLNAIYNSRGWKLLSTLYSGKLLATKPFRRK